MSRLRLAPSLMLALVAGCVAAPPTPQATPEPLPTIIVTYASPVPGASASVASPTPSPEATPSPARVESASFFFVPPAGWTVLEQTAQPERVRLRAADGRSTFTVAADPLETDLAKRRAAAVKEAGAGIVSNTSATLDQLPGYTITSNRDTADGKRYVVEYGFAYRGRVFTLQGSWDKREDNAGAIAADVQTLIKTFKWL